ncbi:hypothetical protein [Allosphingosinicella sp.]|uniref:hypothetical protein n=1 Tax=Allosphingosinicella sp. TaxID=2823234 RepID=UPI0037838DD7
MPLLVALALLAAQTPPPHEENYGPHGAMQDMTCPVGGEHFRALMTGSYSTMGSRPDGRPNTYWFMPLPMPECPSNGLVLFDTFAPADLAILNRLIPSGDYRSLRGESTYYRAQWLATRLGRSETRALQLLLAATWQVKPAHGPIGQPLPSPERAQRYQEEFIARVRALPPAPDEQAYFVLYVRAANAERELGHFDRAAEMLRQASAMPVATRSADAAAFLVKLTALVARRDAYGEPLDMVDEVQLGWLCLDETLPDTPFNRETCARPDVRARIEAARRVQAQQARTR